MPDAPVIDYLGSAPADQTPAGAIAFAGVAPANQTPDGAVTFAGGAPVHLSPDTALAFLGAPPQGIALPFDTIFIDERGRAVLDENQQPFISPGSENPTA